MKYILSRIIVLISALTAAITMPLSVSAQQTHGIAAVVNDDIITTFDLQQRALFMIVTQGIKPDAEAQDRILRQARRNLIDEKLQVQEAAKFNIEISDDAIINGMRSLVERNGMTLEDFAQRLAGANITLRTLQDQVRAEIAWQRIIGGLYGSRIRISDAQVDETLNQITASAGKPSYHVAEIYIEATPDIGGMNGAMQGANAMIEQVNQGAPFPILAQQFSSAASAAKGGDIGWVTQGELRSELDLALVGMEKGQISAPITVPGGVYVIVLRDKKVSTSETFYTLNRISYSTESESDLPAARTAIKAASGVATSCDSLAKDIESIDGLESAVMGEVKAGDLTEDILTLLSGTNVGQISEPLTTPSGLISLMVCKRDNRGSDIPTRDQVEDRLLSQQESQASRRHLRNLRRNATIVTK